MAHHHPQPSSSSSSATAKPPTLHEIIHALELHLAPPLPVGNLPKALGLLAHVALAARSLAAQAETALAVSAACPDPRARLAKVEVRAVHEIAERARDGEERMFAISLALRKMHLARMLRSPKLQLEDIQPTRAAYFPELPDDDHHRSHKALFISSMRTSDLVAYRAAAREVRGWWSAVVRRERSGVPRFAPADLDALGSEALGLAKRVAEDGDELMRMFENTSGSSRARLSAVLSSIPPPPTLKAGNAVAPALAIPVSEVGQEHVGRKLRLVVQIVEIDTCASHAIVADSPRGGSPTLLVALSTALLGLSPAAAPDTASASAATAPRQRLALQCGEWITVVGYLESSGLEPNENDDEEPPVVGFARPPAEYVFEAFFVAPAREPPAGVAMRGEIAR